MESFHFFSNFIKNPSTVGSLIPSSKALARLMVQTAQVSQSKTIVEFGAGTGVFTEEIQRKRIPESHFFSFEIDTKFAEITQKRCPDVNVINDSASRTLEILQQHNLTHCDCIVSGLPWATLPNAIQTELFDVMKEALRPGGIFVTFGYVQSSMMPNMLRFREKLDTHFSKTGVSAYVWSNVPPARAYWAKK